jgi:hypothetical protein
MSTKKLFNLSGVNPKKAGRPEKKKINITTRITADFSEAANNILNKVAIEQQASKSEILRRSIGLYDIYQENKQKGGHFYFESNDKERKEIVIL